jgi:hypothetical protein
VRAALLLVALAACGGPWLQTRAHERGPASDVRQQPQVTAELQGRSVVFRIDDYARGCGPEPTFTLAPGGEGWVIQENAAELEQRGCRYGVEIRVHGLAVGEHVVLLRRADGSDFSRTAVTIP